MTKLLTLVLFLSSFFCNTAKFWFVLQDDFDIEHEVSTKKAELSMIKKYVAAWYARLGYLFLNILQKLSIEFFYGQFL